MGTVYRHTSPSGNVYIGITSRTVNKRGRTNGEGYKRHNPIIGNAIQKYGGENFKHEILLEEISESEAKWAEKYLIKGYKLHGISYNVTDGGDGQLGRDSIRIEQYDLQGNYIQTFSSISGAAKSLGCSSDSHIGRACKTGKAASGYYGKHEGDDLEFQFPKFTNVSLTQYDLEGNFIANYINGGEAERVTGVDRKLINGAIRRNRFSCGGYRGTYYGQSLVREDNTIKTSVSQYTKEGEFVKSYERIADAVRETGISSSMISNCARGHKKSAGGYIGKYNNK